MRRGEYKNSRKTVACYCLIVELLVYNYVERDIPLTLRNFNIRIFTIELFNYIVI